MTAVALRLSFAAGHPVVLRRPATPAAGAAAGLGVVLVTEPGRVLSARDVQAAADAPVLAEIPLDPQVARLVDAGLLTGRLPPRSTPSAPRR